MKDSFILYTKYNRQIAPLTMEQRGTLFTAILCHENGEELPEMDAITEMAFAFVKVDLEENAQKYEERCAKNAENGAKGGRPKNQTVLEETEKTERFLEKRTQAKKADNDNDNDLKEKSTLTSAKKEKRAYGEYKHVRLTDEEYAKLVDEYGRDQTDAAVRFLDEYIGDKGYKSNSHYLAMRRWVFDALDERKPKPPDRKPNIGKFANFPQRNDQENTDMVARIIATQGG